MICETVAKRGHSISDVQLENPELNYFISNESFFEVINLVSGLVDNLFENHQKGTLEQWKKRRTESYSKLI